MDEKLEQLLTPAVKKIFSSFSKAGFEARIVGGSLRNALLGKPISDIDIATTSLPEQTIEIAQQNNFKTIATGLKHGTVSLICDGHSFEVTSLRRDVETDGRHAIVEFCNDWQEDAKRRDFTINALYLDQNGQIYDYVNGLGDITARKIRFIGDAKCRIEEDYLRILRFFRFYCYYDNKSPDRDAILACSALKHNLIKISAERIWYEFKKILAAPHPLATLLWMRKSGVLSQILPQSEKWGIDYLPKLLALEKQIELCRLTDLDFELALLRLIAIIPKNQIYINEICQQFRLSNRERKLLQGWMDCNGEMNISTLPQLLYKHQKSAIFYNLMLSSNNATRNNLQKLSTSEIPKMPINAKDIISLGFAPGKELGAILKKIEKIWLESNCTLGKEEIFNYISKNSSIIS